MENSQKQMEKESFDIIDFLSKMPTMNDIDKSKQEVDLETKLKEMLKLCEEQNNETND